MKTEKCCYCVGEDSLYNTHTYRSSTYESPYTCMLVREYWQRTCVAVKLLTISSNASIIQTLLQHSFKPSEVLLVSIFTVIKSLQSWDPTGIGQCHLLNFTVFICTFENTISSLFPFVTCYYHQSSYIEFALKHCRPYRAFMFILPGIQFSVTKQEKLFSFPRVIKNDQLHILLPMITPINFTK